MHLFVQINQHLDYIIKQTGITNKKKTELLRNMCRILPKPVLEHSWRVSEGCMRIAKVHQANMCQEELDLLQSAAYLHDIGKLFINDTILNKPGRLSLSEYAIVKHHTYIGHAMLLKLGARKDVAEALLYHHENSNGTGYPTGISGSQITMPARLIHVMDVYDALTSDRPYRSAYTPSAAVEILRNEHSNYDSGVLNVLVNLSKEGMLG